MPKTILITGASSGIGKATPRLFVAEGWNVIPTMRDPATGDELAKHERGLVGARGFIRAWDGLSNADCVAFMRSRFLSKA